MSLKRMVTSGLVWTFAQQFGNQIIGFVISLILARILLPAEFGLIAMIAVFVAIGNGLLDSGLSKSIMRDREADKIDFSTVFLFNIFIAGLVYFIIFMSAPYIAAFYEQELLTQVLRVYCLSFFFTAATSVQIAVFTRDMNFKVQTLMALPSAIIGGVVGIGLAVLDFGVWSLVYSSLLNSFVGSLIIWKYSDWYPSLQFDKNRFSKHWEYGYKLGLADLLNKIFNNIYLVVIGKFFSPALLGFYTRAESTKQLQVNNIERALNKVSFPLFVKIKDDPERLKIIFRKLLKMVLFIVSPALLISAALAEPLFRFLFTEKWLPAVPFFQVLCLGGIFLPLHSYNLSLLNIYGRSDLFLKLEMFKKILIVLSILLIIPFGIFGLLWGQVILSIAALFVNARYTQQFILYNLKSQFEDVLPIYLLAFLSAVVVWVIDTYFLVKFSDIVRILSGGILGLLMVLIFSRLGNFKQIPQLIGLIRDRNRKKAKTSGKEWNPGESKKNQ